MTSSVLVAELNASQLFADRNLFITRFVFYLLAIGVRRLFSNVYQTDKQLLFCPAGIWAGHQADPRRTTSETMSVTSCRRCSDVARWKSRRIVFHSCEEHLCAAGGERVPELETDDCRRQRRKTDSSPHRYLPLLSKIQRRSARARRR